MKHLKFNSQQTFFLNVPLKKNIYIRNNTYSCFTIIINKYAFSRGTANVKYCNNMFAYIGTIAASSLPFHFFFFNLTFENIEKYIEFIQNYAEPLHVRFSLLGHFGRDKTE